MAGETYGTLVDEDIRHAPPKCRPTRHRQAEPQTASAQSSPVLGALRRCIDPMETGEFFSEYYERRPLHTAARRGRTIRRPALSLPTPRRWRRSWDPLPGVSPRYRRRADRSRRIHARASWSTPVYCPDVADTGKVLTAFDAGATIALQGLSTPPAARARFCRSLEAELTHPVQANAYFTPPDAQAFPSLRRARRLLAPGRRARSVAALRASGSSWRPPA